MACWVCASRPNVKVAMLMLRLPRIVPTLPMTPGTSRLRMKMITPRNGASISMSLSPRIRSVPRTPTMPTPVADSTRALATADEDDHAAQRCFNINVVESEDTKCSPHAHHAHTGGGLDDID